MTLLPFEAAGTRYGLDIRQVIEVIPAVALRPVAHAPAWLAGVFQHRGAMTPVVDASTLLTGTPVRERFSTRIVIATYADANGASCRVGLRVESATDMFTTDEASLQAAGVTVPDARYLGPVARMGDTLVQVIRVEEILPDSVRALLTAGDDT
jgi:chemotaxis-related protein WspB